MQDPLIIALGVFLLAGIVKGTVGIGLPITSVGLLSQIIDPRLAVTLAIFPIVVSNIWQVFRSGDVRAAFHRYWTFGAVLVVVLGATTLFATKVSPTLLIMALGFIIVLFAVISLTGALPHLPKKYDRIGQIIGGIFSGISGGLTAIWAPPMIMYFLARRIDKDEFVRAAGVLFLCGSIPLVIGYIYNGLIDLPTAKMSAILVIPTLAGFSIGEILRRKISPERFRKLVLILFLLIGLNLLRRALFG